MRDIPKKNGLNYLVTGIGSWAEDTFRKVVERGDVEPKITKRVMGHKKEGSGRSYLRGKPDMAIERVRVKTGRRRRMNKGGWKGT